MVVLSIYGYSNHVIVHLKAIDIDYGQRPNFLPLNHHHHYHGFSIYP